MTDRDRDKPSKPPRPARPTPAREGAPAPKRPSAGGDGGKGAPPSPARPQGGEPAGPPPPVPEEDVEQASVDIDGRTWIVRVLGRAGGGASVGVQATVPLLMLGFQRLDAEGGAERESLVVGRALSALTPEQLEAAFEKSTPARSDSGQEPPDDRGRRGGERH